MTDELKCRSCGHTEFRAWYTVPEGQDITLSGVENGIVQYDYDGNTKSADCMDGDDEFWCLRCEDNAKTIEELVGLPAPPTTYRTEVFDSEGTLAIMRADGQDVAHLVFTDKTTAADDAAEATWRQLTDAERQWIIDRVVEVIR